MNILIRSKQIRTENMHVSCLPLHWPLSNKEQGKKIILKKKEIKTCFRTEYCPLMNNMLSWVFDVLGSCFLKQQMDSHFNETTTGIHHWHLHLSNNQCAERRKCMDYWRLSGGQNLTELLFLNRFRQNQNENTSKKLIVDLIFDPLTDSTHCARLSLILGCQARIFHISFGSAVFMNGGR